MSKKCCGKTYMDTDRFCTICGKELIDIEDDIVDDFYEEEEEVEEEIEENEKTIRPIIPNVIESNYEGELDSIRMPLSDTTIDEAINKNKPVKANNDMNKKEKAQDSSHTKDKKQHKSKTAGRLKLVMIAMLVIAIIGLIFVGVTTVKEVMNAPYKEYIKSNNKDNDTKKVSATDTEKKEKEPASKSEDSTGENKNTAEGTSGGDESPSQILKD